MPSPTIELEHPLVSTSAEVPVEEWDEIKISGYCQSEGRFFYNLPGTVGTLDRPLIKVWPRGEHKTRDGKLWFDLRHCRIQVTRTD